MTNTWQGVRDEVERRLHQGIWKQGERIPSESSLSEEFGCARATVNRALQSLANSGLVERKRKAGTRVSRAPQQKLGFHVPLLRHEIESTGSDYTHLLLKRRTQKAPRTVMARMGLSSGDTLLHLHALHLADSRPYCFEDRWINPAAVPDLASVRFDSQSANEYLVHNVPYSEGDLNLCAKKATPMLANVLEVDAGAAVFQMIRTTWLKDIPVTSVTLNFPPGYQFQAKG